MDLVEKALNIKRVTMGYDIKVWYTPHFELNFEDNSVAFAFLCFYIDIYWGKKYE